MPLGEKRAGNNLATVGGRDAEGVSAEKGPALSKRGNFFGIDRRAWAAVCDLGSINAAVSYLVLARGTLGDMRTTAWSVKAIETHTGVPRHLAQLAVKRLISEGLIRQTRSGTKPLYYLVAPHEFPVPAPIGITHDEDVLLRIIEDAGRSTFVPKVAKYDSDWPNTTPFETACSLVRKGHLTDDGGQHFGLTLGPEPLSEEPDWIWLPASIVTGAADETAPVELLRQSQELPALRLFVDLYHAQSLPRAGGVHWRTVRMNYTRQAIGTYGAHTVWGFSATTIEAWPHRPLVSAFVDRNSDKPIQGFFDALRLLMRTGLVAYALHIIEADTEEAAVLFPVGGALSAKEEQAVGDAAHNAGLAMITDWQEKLSDGAYEYLFPLLPHQSKATMVGLIRLRYQADTAANAEWGERRPQWAEQAQKFQDLAEKAQASQGFATSTRHQI